MRLVLEVGSPTVFAFIKMSPSQGSFPGPKMIVLQISILEEVFFAAKILHFNELTSAQYLFGRDYPM